jgi:hypothetical protein
VLSQNPAGAPISAKREFCPPIAEWSIFRGRDRVAAALPRWLPNPTGTALSVDDSRPAEIFKIS